MKRKVTKETVRRHVQHFYNAAQPVIKKVSTK